MLAAVALAVTLPPIGWFTIGGIDGGQFTVMFLGGILGLVIMRFAANWFVKLLHTKPSLGNSCFSYCRLGWCKSLLYLHLPIQKSVSFINISLSPQDGK